MSIKKPNKKGFIPNKEGFTPNAKGFTLVELIIYIALMALIVGSLVSFTLSISSGSSQTNTVQEVQSNARIALDIISQKVRHAEDVVSPTEGNNGNSMELDMPTPDPNITFAVSGGVLTLNGTEITSDEVNVTSLIFTNRAQSGERDSMKVEITVEFRDPETKEFEYSQTLTTAVGLRQ